MNQSPETPSAYEELVATIVKAVPEIKDEKGYCRKCSAQYYSHRLFSVPERCTNERCEEPLEITKFRPITLEDVLRALDVSKNKTTFDMRVCLNGQFANYYGAFQASWHLGHPLEWHRDNAPETITFLHSLLCLKK